ncbi:hypothetical protein ACFFGH_33070 [Lysobacter korlensis]|uniref:DUF7882 domain-containing protein n=1 Tax=Lysobacter korlensis TaxID=553636 RepID=A0ABV6S3J0_9GAMM
MGLFSYGVAPVITIEDRLLKHLQAVIVAKLRRRENFAFNWDQEPGVGTDVTHENGSHGSVWISESSSLYFQYDGSPSMALNRAWLEDLMQAANTSTGLRAVPEPAARGV